MGVVSVTVKEDPAVITDNFGASREADKDKEKKGKKKKSKARKRDKEGDRRQKLQTCNPN